MAYARSKISILVLSSIPCLFGQSAGDRYSVLDSASQTAKPTDPGAQAPPGTEVYNLRNRLEQLKSLKAEVDFYRSRKFVSEFNEAIENDKWNRAIENASGLLSGWQEKESRLTETHGVKDVRKIITGEKAPYETANRPEDMRPEWQNLPSDVDALRQKIAFDAHTLGVIRPTIGRPPTHRTEESFLDEIKAQAEQQKAGVEGKLDELLKARPSQSVPDTTIDPSKFGSLTEKMNKSNNAKTSSKPTANKSIKDKVQADGGQQSVSTPPKSTIYVAPNEKSESYLNRPDSLRNQGQDPMYRPPDSQGKSYLNRSDSLKNQGQNTMYKLDGNGNHRLTVTNDLTNSSNDLTGTYFPIETKLSPDGLRAKSSWSISTISGTKQEWTLYDDKAGGKIVITGLSGVQFLGGGKFAVPVGSGPSQTTQIYDRRDPYNAIGPSQYNYIKDLGNGVSIGQDRNQTASDLIVDGKVIGHYGGASVSATRLSDGSISIRTWQKVRDGWGQFIEPQYEVKREIRSPDGVILTSVISSNLSDLNQPLSFTPEARSTSSVPVAQPSTTPATRQMAPEQTSIVTDPALLERLSNTMPTPGRPPDTGGIYLGGQQQYKKSSTLADDFEAALKDAEERPVKKRK